MNQKLIVILSQDRFRKPGTTVDGLPGGGADLSPSQLRALAKTLNKIADDAEAEPMGKRSYRQKTREYIIEK